MPVSMALTPYQQLEHEFQRLHALRGAASILRWDLAVVMPSGGAASRGEQLAALEDEAHSLLISPRVSRLLERAEANQRGLDDWQCANLVHMRRERDHALATPHSLIGRLARATVSAEAAWRQARQTQDFSPCVGPLQEVVALVRDKAALLGKALAMDPYDALLDEVSPGLRRADIDAVFAILGQRLPGFIQDAIEKQAGEPALALTGNIDASRRHGLALRLLQALSFDFSQGRLDSAQDAASAGLPGDTRITARLDVSDPLAGVGDVLRAAGRARYAQGRDPAWRGQPVGRALGLMVDHSQGLLLEQVIGRDEPFLQFLQPLLLQTYGVAGPAWEVPNLSRHLRQVRRSLLRVDADEITQPMHGIVRYELEQALLDGKLAVRNLPEAWDARLADRLGARPADVAQGCLQDIHWARGLFGQFPAQVMGAMLAAQLNESLRVAHPTLDEELLAGEFQGLFDWLHRHVHAVASAVSLPQLIEQATGKRLSAGAWLRHVEYRYL